MSDPVRLEIPTWSPPYPAGSRTFVRLTPTHLRDTGCAEQVALKARPDVWPNQKAPWEPPGVGDFPLGLVRDALLAVLAEGTPATEAVDRAIDESWQDWSPDSRAAVEAGVAGYLEVLQSLRAAGDLPETLVFPHVVAVQDPDTDRVELWAWALHHISVDGALREAHLLRWRGAGTAPLSDAEVALVAYVAGVGVIAEHDRWWRPFQPTQAITQPPPAQRVRVRVIGMLDATDDVRFDGTPDEAAVRVQREAPDHLGILAGGRTRPSGRCADCKVRHVCTGPLRLPGLLGVTGYSPRTRALTPSDLWTHRACPRQLHLIKDLGLPRAPTGDSRPLVRGTQVHAWLAAAHARGIACTHTDLPEDLRDESLASDLGWTAEQYERNRPYLLQHLGHCPFDRDAHGAGALGLVTELAVTAWDTDANVVFSTRPDTAWRTDSGRWVLRETKTLNPRGLPEDRTELLARYPQVAASICLLADGYTPDGAPADRPGVVQLELLGPEEGAVIEYDASDPVVVLVARTHLADRVDAWLFDTDHPIGAHPPCQSCEVLDWCEARPVSVVEDMAAGLIAALPATPGWDAPDAVIAEVVGAEAEEEFPF